jgi:epoxyqueuosine reductase
VISATPASGPTLEQSIREEASRLGFILAGFTTPDPPPHLSVFEDWLNKGRHASMAYLARGSSLARRADPRLSMPGCKSIIVLAIAYSDPTKAVFAAALGERQATGRIAAYAWGTDYHTILPQRLRAIVAHIEEHVGHPVRSRCYTDAGPILERDFAERAGLGWIGKNTCLISPRVGSYLLLAEILVDLELEPDAPFAADRCGSCTRCIDACPTACILSDRTVDASRCLSYLTIELKEGIPSGLRPKLGNWIFGCDVCQMVCPWNRFAAAEGDAAFLPRARNPRPNLSHELELGSQQFSDQFRHSPVKRAKRRGYLRNVAVALGNLGTPDNRLDVERALQDPEPLVREHAAWAIEQIAKRTNKNE